jgi:lysophospholipase L1-like esterase
MEPLDYQGRLERIHKLGYHGRTSAEAYGENTREILTNLKRHGTQVIFGTSTPVPAYGVRYDAWNWIADYNDVARAVCKELEVPVNDLYAVALPLAADQKDGCHFSEVGYRKLADTVSEAINRYL